MSVNCPLDCPYLLEARKREKPAPLNQNDIPNIDIKISEQFLREHEPLFTFLGQRLTVAAFRLQGAVDLDAREALAGLMKTYRTLQSGVYYESRPANALAASIYDAIQAAVAEFRESEKRSTGMSGTRDADVLGVLAFLQRLEYDRNNGRPRGRAFLHLLASAYGGAPEPPPVSSLVLP